MTRKTTLRVSAIVILCASIAAVALVSCGYFVHPRGPGPATEAAAPPFAIPDQNGKSVSLADLTRNGPAVLVFYRGFW